MRAHPLPLTIALAGLLAVVSCDQAPVEPTLETTPLFKPGDEPPATYSVYFSGGIGTDPTPIPGKSGVGKSSSQVELGYVGVNHSLKMTSSFLSDIAESDKCFGLSGGETPFLGYAGAMQPRKKDGRIEAAFYFRAAGTDGSTEFKYALTLVGDAAADFPPAAGEEVTVSFTEGELNTEGSGKGKKGGNSGSACVGSVVAAGTLARVTNP